MFTLTHTLTNRARSGSLLALLLAFALLAGACGGSSSSADENADSDNVVAGSNEASTTNGEGEGDAENSSDTEAGDTDTGEAEPAAEGDEDATDAAIEQALELISGEFDPSEQEEMWAEQERIVQEKVQQCMTNEGFEYFIVDNSQYVDFGGVDEWDPSNREWVAEYGLGVNTFTFDQGFDEAFEEGGEGEGFSDPNYEYQEGLSEGEAKAYQQALYGDQPDVDFEFEDRQPTEEEMEAMDEAYQNRENIGCYEQAWEDNDMFGGGVDAVFTALEDDFQDLEDRIENDPRIAEALQGWVTCMAEAGYAFGDPEEMYDAAYERSNELWDTFEDPFAGLSDEELEAMSPEDFEDFEIQSGPPDVDEELAAELKEWEITMALASFDCGEPELQTIAQELFAEETKALVENNRDKIAAAIEGDG